MGKSAQKQQASAMREMNRMAQEQFNYYKQQQEEQREVVDQQRAQFEAFEFENPFGTLQNPYSGLQTDFENLAAQTRNVYSGMENPFEDLTVDLQAAEFQARQGDQQRANILSTLRQGAGASGIAGLAQALANQGALQAQQISANISQQEAANQRLAAQGEMQIQQMERAGEADIQKMRLAGAQQARGLEIARQNMIAQGGFQAEAMRLQGDAAVQASEFGRESTLTGLEFGVLAGANQSVQQAMANQMSGQGMMANMYGSQAQGQMSLIGNIAMAAGLAFSDKKLKKNINLIGKSPSGLNIYSFEYIDDKYGKGLFQGVMSDEVPFNAVYSMNGYDMVDYSSLDVEFKRI
tara:strand:+ start:59 stop:1111 length:1053 start_codon:yes stop_codon:yes gene_type:complete